MKLSFILFISILFFTVKKTYSQQNSSIDVFSAVRYNDVEYLKKYIAQKQNIDTLNTQKHSLLILASYNNSLECIDLLLKSGAQTNLQDKSGNTALMGASFKGYTKIVEKLLLAKTDPNVLNYNNANALFFASTFGHRDIVKLLLSYGVDKYQIDNYGNQAIDYAIMQGNKEIVELLKVE
ncbi:ankyrin repeat domain-containing protein [Riemerella anatipestifer]|uniref:Ankyrin repeat domain-containing protein n=2 Tax=Riemerella anatipestifer TaxID=34085 RepID=S5WLH7_RIEAN|nr:ankyrin repeat domain-containing protein [Riemerella anatipestifer]ADQ81219.1 Ankyrin [Riemerella anatipestifer ATCC 11845 = DSM 15868]ADZ11297.1 Ankyrin repeat protein [Riemerella anatipestifer RA-GD]AFD55250.1 ankyrin [Riemerella anatipestifer ATCC 11845 = DSM 15868]AGC40897.1 Ankyrin repeat protein [Riemerella anatipestifer RA-CH-2]AGS82531.1 ankyrin repeat protein [Riemerella anatipestifer]